MTNKPRGFLTTGLAVAFACALSLQAQDPAPTLSVGEQKVLNDIAEQFSDFAGDDAQTLVNALRTGDSLRYVIEVEQPVLDEEGNPVMIEVVNEDGSVTEVEQTELVEQTIVVDNGLGPMGIGNVKLALGLAESSLPEGASRQDIVTALLDSETGSGILDMRADGMGWGEIYRAYDLKVGDIMSAKNSVRANKPEQVEKVARINKPEKPERVSKPEKPEKPQKPEKPDKPGRNK